MNKWIKFGLQAESQKVDLPTLKSPSASVSSFTCRHTNAHSPAPIKAISSYIKQRAQQRDRETLWEKSIVSVQIQVYYKCMSSGRRREKLKQLEVTAKINTNGNCSKERRKL